MDGNGKSVWQPSSAGLGLTREIPGSASEGRRDCTCFRFRTRGGTSALFTGSESDRPVTLTGSVAVVFQTRQPTLKGAKAGARWSPLGIERSGNDEKLLAMVAAVPFHLLA